MSNDDRLVFQSVQADKPIAWSAPPPFQASITKLMWPNSRARIAISGPCWGMACGEIHALEVQREWCIMTLPLEDALSSFYTAVLEYLAGWASRITQENGKKFLLGLLGEKDLPPIPIRPFLVLDYDCALIETIELGQSSRLARLSLELDITQETMTVRARVQLPAGKKAREPKQLIALGKATEEVMATASGSCTTSQSGRTVNWTWSARADEAKMREVISRWPSLSIGEVWTRASSLFAQNER